MSKGAIRFFSSGCSDSSFFAGIPNQWRWIECKQGFPRRPIHAGSRCQRAWSGAEVPVVSRSPTGSAALDRILAAIPTLFDLAAKGILTIAVEPVPLSQVEEAWSRVEKGRRIVFAN